MVATCLPRGDRRSRVLAEARGLAEADILAAVDAHEVEVVAVAADPELAGQSLRRLSWALEQRGVDLIVSPGIVEVAGPRISVRPVAGLSLLHLERPSVSGGPHLIKSVFDRVVGAAAGAARAPVLLLIAVGDQADQPRAGAVPADPGGPRRRRVLDAASSAAMVRRRRGRGARPAGAQRGQRGAVQDASTTRGSPGSAGCCAGFSLDELPQLFNVLRGEMSLVGPRPPLPAEVARYAADDTRRLLVKPGLTGLWQVSGRSDLTWEESVRLDLRYVENWSLALDLLILWKTLRAVMTGSGAY